jgi:hypothetical protein
MGLITKYREAHLLATKIAKEGARKATFILSDSTKDRHGTILNQNGWNLENYNLNPIVGYNHNYGGTMCDGPSPDNIIGTSKVWVEEGMLIGEVTFEPEGMNTLADKIWKKIEVGTIRAASVGFLEIGKGHKGDERNNEDITAYYFEGQELLEWSIVDIPSNPKAGKRMYGRFIAQALTFVRSSLGDKYSLGDIENLYVKDVVSLLENGRLSNVNENNEDGYENELDNNNVSHILDCADIELMRLKKL